MDSEHTDYYPYKNYLNYTSHNATEDISSPTTDNPTKQWLYSYKIATPRIEFSSSATGSGNKHMERTLDGEDKERRRRAYSHYIEMNPPENVLPYRSPLLPPASRYSRPGAMDPQIKYDRRMEYSASVAAAHADSLAVSDKSSYCSNRQKTEVSCIDPKSALSKRLAYDKSMFVKSHQQNDRNSGHKESGMCDCCSACLLQGAPSLRYSANGSVIGSAPLKASWSSNVKAKEVAYPDVTVRGYSCPVTNEKVTTSNIATPPRKSTRYSRSYTRNDYLNSGSDCNVSRRGLNGSMYGYQPNSHITGNGYQFTSNMVEVLKHVRVSARCQPHLLARPPLLRVTGLCQDKVLPPNTPRCTDDLYNALTCSATLGDRYGSRRVIPQCSVTIYAMNNTDGAEASEEHASAWQPDSPKSCCKAAPFSLSYRPFF